jgi:hypothetical protein
MANLGNLSVPAEKVELNLDVTDLCIGLFVREMLLELSPEPGEIVTVELLKTRNGLLNKT